MNYQSAQWNSTGLLARLVRELGFSAVTMAAVTGCGMSGGTDMATPIATSSVRMTSDAPSATSTRVVPTTTAAAPTTTVVPVAPPTTAAAPIVLMPAVVCMNLQEAQNRIQAAGVFFSRSTDATGKGRAQVLDRNWVVVAQSPAPDVPIAEGQAVLSVVKYGEPNQC